MGPRPRFAACGAFLALACGTDVADLPAPPDLAAVRAAVDPDAIGDLESATAAVRKTPERASAWAALGALYETQDAHGHAEVAFEAAATLAPEDPKPRYRAAIVAARAGHTERALEHLDAVLELSPDYGPAWRRAGTWRLELGDTARAKAAFERAEQLLPGHADGAIGLAQTALQDDRVADAIAAAERAYERSPGDRFVRLTLGNALRRAGRTDEALPHLEAGQGATPRYADPWSVRAAKARRSDEDLANRATQLGAERRWSEALTLWRELEQGRPNDTGVLMQIGKSLLALDRPNEAFAHYEDAVARFPGNYGLSIGRISALRVHRGLGVALAAAQDLVARWPDRAQGHTVLGDLMQRTGNIEGARATFQRAIELEPSDFRGRLFEGRLLLASRRANEAIEVLQAGLDLPGARPPLDYFKLLLQAQVIARRPPDEVQRTLDRARTIHGDAVDALVNQEGSR